jgi:hypothetical protein
MTDKNRADSPVQRDTSGGGPLMLVVAFFQYNAKKRLLFFSQSNLGR